MKRPRLRKWAKWACTLAAMLSVVVAVASRFGWWTWQCVSCDGDTVWDTTIGAGVIRADQTIGWGTLGDQMLASSSIPAPRRFQSGWKSGLLWQRGPRGWSVGMNLFYPVFLTSIPTALLWYAGRRRSGPHACKKLRL